MEYNVFEDRQSFISETLEYLEWLILQFPQATIGLTGGRTPIPIYQALANATMLDFSLLDFFLIDERYVPLDHHESNYKMIRETLGRNPAARIHFFDTGLPLPQCLDLYTKEFAAVPNHSLDIAILGIGTDGHIASLWPGDATLTAAKDPVVHTKNPAVPHPPIADRVSLSYETIMKSKHILLLANNKKADMIEQLLDGTQPLPAPAAGLRTHPQVQIHYLQ